ncbi:hypothetical protein ACHHYP_03412 [Achlya hypogyna]|uniref:Polycystin cation channel PKD1/PKD2 domain-containing protein n=1 Tax=Achlya hypogyna TaxID=1202772 RepID=A0A1V9ZR71_ACHHY|nr:hypothetical protein ACHHYP_03412 [Achlya hypogyna]
MLLVYNGNENNKKITETPLYWVIHNTKYDATRLLEHPVLHDVVMQKWKVFGHRMFIKYVGLYMLFVMTMTHSSTMHISDATAYPIQLQVWVYLGASLGIMVILAWASPGYEHRLNWVLLGIVLSVTSFVIFNHYMERLMAAINWSTFVRTNNILLGVLAVVFLVFEVIEYCSVIANEKRKISKFHLVIFHHWMRPLLITVDFLMIPINYHLNEEYYQSEFNTFQVPTYLAVLVYVVAQLTDAFSDSMNLFMSVTLTFMLWVLGLQLLEVHPTVGYVIPMMRDVVKDVLRFFAFVGPFLCAYTFAYYILFQSLGDKVPPAYSSIPRTFTTTYLVVLGEMDLDPFSELPTTFKYFLGHLLLLSQGTVVFVMLTNMLIAMMAKTVGDGLKKAKTAQMTTFASCVLRCEKLRGFNPLGAYPTEKKEGKPEADQLPFEVYERTTAEQLQALESNLQDFKNQTTKQLQALESNTTERLRALEDNTAERLEALKNDMARLQVNFRLPQLEPAASATTV